MTTSSSENEPWAEAHPLEMLEAYALDALDEEEALQVEYHLDWCGPCSREVARLQERLAPLGLLVERTVSQLNLNNFVASRNVDDDTINFGNPNLQPESSWSYSLGYERRFANDGGSIELKAVYEDITDHIDKILIGTDDSGIGNIGDATRKNLEARISGRQTAP